MSGLWLASYIALWAVVLFQGLAIFLLLRQMGLMYLGTAQGVARDGLPVGERAPDFTVADLEGRPLSLSYFRGLPLLLVFGSPNCAPCKELIPDLSAFAQERREELRVLSLSRGDADATRRFTGDLVAQAATAVHPDETLPDAYQARVTPFAFLIDGEGVIQAKGLTNNREHLDLLLHMSKEQPSSRNGATTGEQPVAQEAHR